MENPILGLCRIHTITQASSERVLCPQVTGRAQNEPSLVFWFEKYFKGKCVLKFGCSEMWSMAVLCFCACLGRTSRVLRVSLVLRHGSK